MNAAMTDTYPQSVDEEQAAAWDASDTTLRVYLQQATAEPLLSVAQERRLAQALWAGRQARERLAALPEGSDEADRLWAVVRAGDQAREQFIRANVRLVVHIAKRFQDRGLPLADLIQEGNVGLLRAIDKYDPTYLNPENGQPYRFSTYAVFWIRQAIRRALGAQGYTIRIPTHLYEHLPRLAAAQEQYRQEEQQEPTAAELAARLDLKEGTVRKLVRVAQPTVSLSAVTREGSEVGEFLEDEAGPGVGEQADRQRFERLLYATLGHLEPRQRRVVALRYGLPPEERAHTLEEVGGAIGVSRERARQLVQQAFEQVRQLAGDALAEYLYMVNEG
jgi:RNA polymerase primary sigma factor